jgi:hypothetical protein
LKAEAENKRSALLAFSEPWRLCVKWISGEAMLTATKPVRTKTVTVSIGPYEDFRETVEQLKLQVAF